MSASAIKWIIRSVGSFDVLTGVVMLVGVPFIFQARKPAAELGGYAVMFVALGIWFLLAGWQVLRRADRASIQRACFVAGFVSVGYTNSLVGFVDSLTRLAFVEAVGHITVFAVIIWLFIRIGQTAVRLLTPPRLPQR